MQAEAEAGRESAGVPVELSRLMAGAWLNGFVTTLGGPACLAWRTAARPLPAGHCCLFLAFAAVDQSLRASFVQLNIKIAFCKQTGWRCDRG